MPREILKSRCDQLPDQVGSRQRLNRVLKSITVASDSLQWISFYSLQNASKRKQKHKTLTK